MDRNSRVSDRERAQLRGAVRTVVDATIETEYDPAGNLLSWRSRNPDGSEHRESYSYNTQGQVQSVISRKWDRSTSEKVYSYDESGRLLYIVDSNGEKSSFDYDKDGHKTESRILNKRGERQAAAIGMDLMFADVDGSATFDIRCPGNASRSKTIYNDRDEPAETQAYDGDGNLLLRIVRIFDDQGRVTAVTETIIDPLSQFPTNVCDQISVESGIPPDQMRAQLAKHLSTFLGESTKSYTYNSRGQIEQATIRSGGLGTFTRTYSFNEHGDIVEEHTVRTDGLPVGVPFKLDDGGKMIPEKPPSEWPPQPDLSPSRTQYSYKYDEQGNWIERTTNLLQQPFTVRRELTYY